MIKVLRVLIKTSLTWKLRFEFMKLIGASRRKNVKLQSVLTSSVFHEITLSANRKTNHSLNVELQVNFQTKFHVDKLILKTKPNPEKK